MTGAVSTVRQSSLRLPCHRLSGCVNASRVSDGVFLTACVCGPPESTLGPANPTGRSESGGTVRLRVCGRRRDLAWT